VCPLISRGFKPIQRSGQCVQSAIRVANAATAASTTEPRVLGEKSVCEFAASGTQLDRRLRAVSYVGGEHAVSRLFVLVVHSLSSSEGVVER
jgi:hypothetical protein